MTSLQLTNRDRELFHKLIVVSRKKGNLTEDDFWDNELTSAEKSNESKIRSRLLKAVENYISLIELDKNKGLRTLLLTTFYYDNKLMDDLAHLLKTGIKAVKSIEIPDIKNKVILSWLYDKLINIRKNLRKEDEYLNLMDEQLTDFYKFNKLRIICEKISRHRIINNGNPAVNYIHEVETLKSESDDVNIYYNLFKLLEGRKQEHFDEINLIVLSSKYSLQPDICKELYTHLMNYCIGKINIGEFKFALFYFNYIQRLEKEDLLLDDGILGIGRYKNALTVGLILNKVKWADDFIERHSKNIQDTKDINREAFHTFNKAIIKLWSDQLDKCYSLLIKFKNSNMYSKDIYYKISCDKLLLKVMYEQNETKDYINNNINALRKYLGKRKDLNQERKKRNRNFLRLLEHLVNNKSTNIKNERSQFLISDYLWLDRIQKKGKQKMPPNKV